MWCVSIREESLWPAVVYLVFAIAVWYIISGSFFAEANA
jgi:hypothetical protein